MKRLLILLLPSGGITLSGYAQMVYKGSDNKVYLDCTARSKMPAEAVNGEAKCVKDTASNSAFRNGTTASDPYARENDKVYEKLEIAAADLAKPGASTTDGMDWATAYNGCKAKNSRGVTGWRLPTQRELMLIYIFRDQIGQLTGQSFSSDDYWSSSSDTDLPLYSWSVAFGDGITSRSDKTYNYCVRVRCVREIAP